MTKIAPHVNNKAKFYSGDLCKDVMLSIGCGTNGFKLGRTQIFLRPKNEKFRDLLFGLDVDSAKKIAHEVRTRFKIRQRHSLQICCRFVGHCKFDALIFVESLYKYVLIFAFNSAY